MYACVCDWLGFPYREEVQWVSACLVLMLFSATCTNDERTGKSKVLDKRNPKHYSSIKIYLVMYFLTGC